MEKEEEGQKELEELSQRRMMECEGRREDWMGLAREE